MRRAPEERGHIKIIRGSGIFLVNHFVDGGTLLCFLRGVMWLDGPGGMVLLPGLWLLLSAPLIPASPKADRRRRTEVEARPEAHAANLS